MGRIMPIMFKIHILQHDLHIMAVCPVLSQAGLCRAVSPHLTPLHSQACKENKYISISVQLQHILNTMYINMGLDHVDLNLSRCIF